jgi:F0F1-type ATP synthase delta subunit
MNSIIKFIIKENKTLDIKVLVSVLQKYRVLSLLPIILKRLEKELLLQQQHNITTIQAPFALDETSKQKIQTIFNVDSIKEVISPNILAGFRAYNGDKILDLSLESIVKKIKN